MGITGTSLASGLWSSLLRVNPNNGHALYLPAIGVLCSFSFFLSVYVPWRLGTRLFQPSFCAMFHFITLFLIRTSQTIVCQGSVHLCLFYPTARILLSLSIVFCYRRVTPPHCCIFFFLPLFRVHCRRRRHRRRAPLAFPVPHSHFSPHLFY